MSFSKTAIQNSIWEFMCKLLSFWHLFYPLGEDMVLWKFLMLIVMQWCLHIQVLGILVLVICLFVVLVIPGILSCFLWTSGHATVSPLDGTLAPCLPWIPHYCIATLSALGEAQAQVCPKSKVDAFIFQDGLVKYLKRIIHPCMSQLGSKVGPFLYFDTVCYIW